jgi:hypothetical protein
MMMSDDINQVHPWSNGSSQSLDCNNGAVPMSCCSCFLESRECDSSNPHHPCRECASSNERSSIDELGRVSTKRRRRKESASMVPLLIYVPKIVHLGKHDGIESTQTANIGDNENADYSFDASIDNNTIEVREIEQHQIEVDMVDSRTDSCHSNEYDESMEIPMFERLSPTARLRSITYHDEWGMITAKILD